MYKMISTLCMILLICLSLSVGTICLAETEAQLQQTKENVYSLIDADKYAEAKSAIDKLAADFSNSQNLAETRYWIAASYERKSKFAEAKQIYQQTIQNHTGSPFADKARLGLSRTDAMSLVMSGKYNQARGVISKMAADFAGNPDLPETLYWTTERFQRVDRFEDAKQLYQQIVQNFPNTPWADKARLFIARLNATSLIVSQDYNEARKAIDKLSVDFAGKPDLPEALYWITDRYERAGKYEDAKRNFQLIAQNFPNSPYADKARLSVSKENAISLIISKDFVGAKAALDKMVVDFAGRPELPETLYWITERYEQVDKFNEAKSVYQQIIGKFPDSPYAEKARLGLRRVDVMALMDSNDSNQAEAALNKMITDFNGNSDLPWALFIIGEKCYLDAKTPDFMQRSLKIFEKIMTDYTNSESIANVYPDVYRYAGDCYSQQKAHSKALACYKKVFDEYPDYPFGWKTLNMMVYNYDVMKFSGVMSESEAETKVLETYLQLLEKYPKCEAAKKAQKRIDLINSK